MSGSSPSSGLAQVGVIGEALVDIINSPDGERSVHAGGSPFNVAVGLGSLGVSTSLATQIGDDAYGELVRDRLRRAQVYLAEGSVTGSATSTATAQLDAAGSATYEFDIDWSPEAVLTEGAPIVHTGSLATVLQPGAQVVEDVIRSLPESTLRTYDPNIRPSAGTPEQLRACSERFVNLAHVVKLSDEDARFLYPGLSLRAVASSAISRGARLVVITRGARGCYVRGADWERELPAERVEVKDTVGAGDSFMAGFIFEVVRTDLAARLMRREVDPQSALKCVGTALESAALTVSHVGARPAHREELTGRD